MLAMASAHVAGRSTEAFREIGVRLAAVRVERGLTQRDLGARLGKPHSYVSKIENAERRLDVIDLTELAAALEMGREELLTRLMP